MITRCRMLLPTLMNLDRDLGQRPDRRVYGSRRPGWPHPDTTTVWLARSVMQNLNNNLEGTIARDRRIEVSRSLLPTNT